MFCQKCGYDNGGNTQFCKNCGVSLSNNKSTKSIVKAKKDNNLKGLLCYLVGWITGIIFYITEKENQFIRFHAIQSIFTFGGLSILGILINTLLSTILWRLLSILNTIILLATIFLWIFLMYKAYKGKRYKLPIIGELAKKHMNK